MKLLTVILVMLLIVMTGATGIAYYNNQGKNSSKEISSSYVETSADERPSPFTRIGEEQIKVYSDRVVIYLKNPEWATFTNTNSMDPVLDDGAYAIQVVPKSEDEIHVGDIVSYNSSLVDGIIIHRVISIGNDEKGTYYIVKGDNNPSPDPERVRFSQITRLVVVVVY